MSSNNNNKFDIDIFVDEDVIQEAYDNDNHNTIQLIGSIDQGTSSSRFLVFTKYGKIAASAQKEFTQIYPSSSDNDNDENGGNNNNNEQKEDGDNNNNNNNKVGWHEHDPIEIWLSVVDCVNAVSQALKESTHKIDITSPQNKLLAIGITNQRETTVCWNDETGIPYYNAIVWDDLRTTLIAKHISQGNTDCFREKTGLPVASYFAGTKVKWLLDNVSLLRNDLNNPTKRNQIRFGTIDTWLVYQLTGSVRNNNNKQLVANKGGMHITDVSNASRWLFMDIHAIKWDQNLIESICYPYYLDPNIHLPQICSSSGEIYGTCSSKCGNMPALKDVPISGILGDQQSALFGQCAFQIGEAKCTYGTGLFLMMNTGTSIIKSHHGLLTTIAYQIGGTGDKKKETYYALEGSVSHSGSTIQYLRDQLQIISKASESETLAKETTQNDGLYFVPAFAGLFAPYWRSDARACIVGMTTSHTKHHVCRAALEATAYQTREVFDAMYADTTTTTTTSSDNDVSNNMKLKSLRVDGGGTANDLLMQFQCDMINVPVIKPQVMETTARGVAFAAGLTIGLWKNTDELCDLWKESHTYHPSMSINDRTKFWYGWKKAITKSIGWIDDNENNGISTNTNMIFNGNRNDVVDEDDDDGEDGYETAATEEEAEEDQQQQDDESEKLQEITTKKLTSLATKEEEQEKEEPVTSTATNNTPTTITTITFTQQIGTLFILTIVSGAVGFMIGSASSHRRQQQQRH